MSLQIQLKKSAVSQKQPFASDLAVGELALNYNADGPFLTCKDSAGNVRKLNNVWVSTTSPTGPSAGDLWLDTSAATAVLKVYKNSTSSWVNATSIPVATTTVFGTVRLATSADIDNATAGKVVDAAQLQSKITAAFSQDEITLNDVDLLGDLVIAGDLTVNGTTTTVSTQTLLVEDKNIEMGVVATPSDTTADGGGLTLKGATDKTLNWVNATDSWTSSENVDLASGKSYRINGTEVLSATALGSAVQISSANIPNGTIVDSDINAAAEIAVSKLADGAARQLLQTDVAGTGVEWTSNVDVPGTLDVTGAATFDSTAAHPIGTAAAPTITFTGDPNTGIYSPGADQVAISTNGTGRLFVDDAGRVGINGTPSTVLDVFSTSEFQLGLQARTSSTQTAVGNHPIAGLINTSSASGNGVALRFSIADTGGASRAAAQIGAIATAKTASSVTADIYFAPGAVERMRLDSSGRLGLGTSSPAALCHLRSDADGAVTHLYLQNRSAGANAQSRIAFTNSANDLADNRHAYIGTVTAGAGQNGNSFVIATNPNGGSAQERVWVSSAGNVGIGTTSPSALLHVSDASAKIRIGVDASSQYTDIYRDNSTGFTIYNAAQAASFRGHVWQLGGTEAARIDSSGRLLVGTSTSVTGLYGGQGTFQVNGANGQTISYFANTAVGVRFDFVKSRNATTGQHTIVQSGDDLGGVYWGGSDGSAFVPAAYFRAEVDGTPGSNDMPGRLVFSTTADGASSPTERMRISSAGTIFLNTTNDATDANAAGVVATSSGALIARRDGGSALFLNRYTSDGNIVTIYRSGTAVGSISVTTTATAYNTSSDYRLKENVVPLTGAANRLNQLQVHRFNFIADPGKTVDGFLAHEAQAVVPEAVHGTKDEVDADGNPVYQGIDQSKLVPLLTAALQEAIGRIETLETEIAALKGA